MAHETDLFAFEFGVPLRKSQSPESVRGEKLWCIEGIAATEDVDQQQERLLMGGMDFSPFLKSGVINWNHQDTPGSILGEPIDARIIKKGGAPQFFVKGFLYKHQPMAQELWTHLNGIAKGGDPVSRSVGWSVQGGVTERRNKDLVKSVVRHCAVTHEPVNAQTFANLAKSLAALKEADLQPRPNEGSLIKSFFSPCPKSCVDTVHKSFRGGLHGMLNHLVVCQGVPVEEAQAFVTLLVQQR